MATTSSWSRPTGCRSTTWCCRRRSPTRGGSSPSCRCGGSSGSPTSCPTTSSRPPTCRREWQGRAIRCRRLDMVPVECIARGYLAGLGLKEYQATGDVSGVRAAGGPGRGRPAARAHLHADHQGAGRRARRVHHVRRRRRPGRRRTPPRSCAGSRWRCTARGAEIAAANGIIIADTKLEFGRDAARRRSCWPTRCSPRTRRGSGRPPTGRPGRTQYAFDKQMVRDWAAGTGWDKTPPGPDDPRRRRRGDAGPLHRGVRAHHRQPSWGE